MLKRYVCVGLSGDAEWVKVEIDTVETSAPIVNAGAVRQPSRIAKFSFYLQNHDPFAHFACLVRAIDSLMRTSHAPYPVERTLLTTGILDAVMTSNADKGKKIETPHLAIKYTPTEWPFETGPVPKEFKRF